jgi:predicted GTPase
MGAAGRDFHNFNVFFRNNPRYQVVAFTATQIPDIEGRQYPAELAGELYPQGIPIHAEAELDRLIRELAVDQVIFAYSDVSHETVMHKASQVLAAGADYRLMGPKHTMLRPASRWWRSAPCAPAAARARPRAGCAISCAARASGSWPFATPCPTATWPAQAVQRFASYADLDRHDCTIEEREEYEPHIDRGVIVYAGVDYEAILRQAEQEADVMSGTAATTTCPSTKPDLHIVVADPHRPGHELPTTPARPTCAWPMWW